MIATLRRAALLVAIGAVPAAAALVVVEAEFPERLPTPPSGKLAPAFVATVKVNGRFLGITTDKGQAVIETPPSVSPSDARGLLFDPVSFPSVAAWAGEPYDPITDVVMMYRQGIDVTSLAAVPPVVGGFTVKERYAPGQFVVLDGAGAISARAPPGPGERPGHPLRRAELPLSADHAPAAPRRPRMDERVRRALGAPDHPRRPGVDARARRPAVDPGRRGRFRHAAGSPGARGEHLDERRGTSPRRRRHRQRRQRLRRRLPGM